MNNETQTLLKKEENKQQLNYTRQQQKETLHLILELDREAVACKKYEDFIKASY